MKNIKNKKRNWRALKQMIKNKNNNNKLKSTIQLVQNKLVPSVCSKYEAQTIWLKLPAILKKRHQFPRTHPRFFHMSIFVQFIFFSEKLKNEQRLSVSHSIKSYYTVSATFRQSSTCLLVQIICKSRQSIKSTLICERFFSLSSLF